MILPDPPGGSRSASEAATLRARLAAAEIEIADVRAAANGASTRAAAELEACRATLRVAEEVGQTLESAAEFAFFASDLERRITLWSEGAWRLFGYEAREILGQPCDLLFTPEDRAADVPGEELRAVVSEGRAPNERWLLRRDGVRFWASGVAMPVGGSDAARGLVKIVRDATERHLADTALLESEARFHSLFDAAPVMMWVTDADGSCTLLNRQWCEFTGQTEAAGMGGGWLEVAHPEDRDALEAAFIAANARRESFRGEFRLRRADGAWRWVIDAARPRFEDGTYLGLVGSVIDITERREVEARQALLAREIDHRAKNALAVVQAALRLTPANDVRSYAEAVEGRVTALARAHTLLAESRWSGVELHSLIRAELAGFHSAGTAGGPRIDLDGPPVILEPQAVQPLSIVIHELATNATKHGGLSVPDGRVSVSWRFDWAAGVLRLQWAETGAPPIPGEPARRGFGSRVIEATVRGQLGGMLSREWPPTGLVCELAVPLERTVGRRGSRHSM
jgi:PAS domain S-box-containing protein